MGSFTNSFENMIMEDAFGTTPASPLTPTTRGSQWRGQRVGPLPPLES